MPSQKTGSVRKRNKPRPSLSPSPAPAPTTDMEVLSSPSTTKARASRANGRKSDKVGDEEVSMSLLGESERQAAAEGLEPEPEHHDEEKRLKAPMSSKDKAAMALLITLCMCVSNITWLGADHRYGRSNSRHPDRSRIRLYPIPFKIQT
ncbi:hypothetical protein AG1IA_09976 [Rhizoctonia solani AG-1 IA]|uniref:Uncharacterized protein n=1 Tax=Thanatephorus cucumeris (strain AG1-IA) TaxID=983506 RepID=L8WHY6_THACA|nr:hypothetical protein AG1IA_09976 [Rhizoctonia solani AG-1 IA]